MPDDLDIPDGVHSSFDTRASDIPSDLAQRLLPVANEYFDLARDLVFRTGRALRRARQMLERYIEAHFLLEGEQLDLQGRYEAIPDLLERRGAPWDLRARVQAVRDAISLFLRHKDDRTDAMNESGIRAAIDRRDGVGDALLALANSVRQRAQERHALVVLGDWVETSKGRGRIVAMAHGSIRLDWYWCNRIAESHELFADTTHRIPKPEPEPLAIPGPHMLAEANRFIRMETLTDYEMVEPLRAFANACANTWLLEQEDWLTWQETLASPWIANGTYSAPEWLRVPLQKLESIKEEVYRIRRDEWIIRRPPPSRNHVERALSIGQPLVDELAEFVATRVATRIGTKMWVPKVVPDEEVHCLTHSVDDIEPLTPEEFAEYCDEDYAFAYGRLWKYIPALVNAVNGRKVEMWYENGSVEWVDVVDLVVAG